MHTNRDISQPCDALLFDVFGTLVDWRTSVAKGLSDFFAKLETQSSTHYQDLQHCKNTDWNEFALDWRALYQPSMQTIRAGQRSFELLDTLHRESLVATLQQHHISGLDDSQIDELVLLWHQLDAWPDVSPAMYKLRQHFTLAALSNGNTQLLHDLSVHANLPWHASLGAQPCQAYKPSPRAYLYSAQLLAKQPQQCMLVAAHNDDLAAARQHGFKTAYVNRPSEYGARQSCDFGAESDWDYVVDSLAELAELLIVR